MMQPASDRHARTKSTCRHLRALMSLTLIVACPLLLCRVFGSVANAQSAEVSREFASPRASAKPVPPDLAPTLAGSGASIYYVSPTGNDHNTGTTKSQAFRTIQQAADVANPGDTVLVMAGTYTTMDPAIDVVRITRSGTANRWITFRNYPGDRPIIFNERSWQGVNIYGASYIIIDGFTVMGNNAGITRTQAEWSAHKDPVTNGNCIMAQKNGDIYPHHLVFRANVVHDCPGSGIGTSYADYVTIQNNIVYHTSWWSKWGTSGISIYESHNIDDNMDYRNFVLGNIVYDNRQNLPAYNKTVITDGNGIIIDDLENAQSGNPSYTGRTLVQNNVSYHNGGRGIHVYHSDHVDVVNNTTFQNGGGELSAVFADDVNFINNVAYARSGHFANYVYGGGGDIVYMNNLFYDGIVKTPGIGDLIHDPLFFDGTTGDFRLRPESPAIDSGSTTLAPASDIVGAVRPQGKGYDRGAYESPS